MALKGNIVALTVAGAAALACAPVAHAADGAEAAVTENMALTAEQVLANPLDESAYARKSRCLATTRYRRIEIVGNMALAFHGRGEDVWLNVLPRRCPGLRTNMVLAIEHSSLRTCARDSFRGMARGNLDVSTSICTLGAFEHMTRERLDVMRDALVALQKTKTVSKTVRAAKVVGEDGV